MEIFFKKLKKEFHKVSVGFKETVEVDNLTIVRSCSEYTFDVVFRDQTQKILFLGYVSSVGLDDFLNEESHFFENQNYVEENIFLFFIKEKKVLSIEHYKTSKLSPFFDLKEFIVYIKDNFPSSRSEVEQLQYEISLLKSDFVSEKTKFLNEKQKMEEDYNKKLEKLNFDLSYTQKELKEKKREIISLNESNSIFLEDILHRLKVFKGEYNFLDVVKKIERPKESTTFNEVSTPSGVYKSVFSTSNKITSDYYTIFKGEIYLRIKIYDYYSKGRLDLSDYVYSGSRYYLLDQKDNEFIQVEKVNFDFWIDGIKLFE